MKKIIIVVVSIITLVSALILPTFADSASQFEFLYDNRNPDITSASQILGNPTADMVIGFSNTIDERSQIASPSFLAVNYCRVYYYDIETARYWYLPGYGSVSLTWENSVLVLTYQNLYSEAQESYKLRYAFSNSGYPSKYINTWWSHNENDEPTGSVSGVQVKYYAFGVPSSSNVFDMQSLEEIDCTISYPYLSEKNYYSGYENGTQGGYSNGYHVGYQEGLQIGEDIGYSQGLEDGSEGMMDFRNLIFSIFDAPFYILATAFDFEVFGINIAATLLGIISVVALVIVLKWLIPKFF